MKLIGVVLISWWVYVNAPVLVAPSAIPVWKWLPKERFLHQEFCELNAKILRREGVEAICLRVDD